MFLVSDDILERLICSQCKTYLSVKTIKVYPNRGIKCGRCSTVGDAGVVSLFGVLAEEALFRCINRFEGCNQLLSYSDVAKHEKSCIGKEYDCPCCTQPFKGTAYEIYIHFKEEHPLQLLMNNPEFILSIDNELVTNYLYRKNDLLFYINARYSRGEVELILSITYFGNNQDARKITQMFTVCSLDTIFKCKTKKKPCCSVNEGNVTYFKLKISPEEVSKNVVCRFDLNTENVESLVALPGNYVNLSKQELEDKKPKLSPYCKELPAIKSVFIPPMLNQGSGWEQPQTTEVQLFEPSIANDHPNSSLPNTLHRPSDIEQSPTTETHIFDPCMANISSNSTVTSTLQGTNGAEQPPTNEVQIFDPYVANEPPNLSFSNALHDTLDIGQHSTDQAEIFNPNTANESSNSSFTNTLPGNSDIGQPSTSEIGIFDTFMANEPQNSPFTDIMHRNFDADNKTPTYEACSFHPYAAHKPLNPPFTNPFRRNGRNGTRSETTVTTASHVQLAVRPYVCQRQISTAEDRFNFGIANNPANSLLTNTLQLNRRSNTGPRLETPITTVTYSSVYYPSNRPPQPTGPTLDSIDTASSSSFSDQVSGRQPTGYRCISPFKPFAFQLNHDPRKVHERSFTRGRINVNELSDNELRKKLKQYGFPAMPVTATTRKVLRKKLKMLLSEYN